MRTLRLIFCLVVCLAGLVSHAQVRPSRQTVKKVVEAPELRPATTPAAIPHVRRILPSQAAPELANVPPPRVVLPPVDLATLKNTAQAPSADESKQQPPRIGIVRPLDVTIKDSGMWAFTDGTAIWRLDIESPSAVGVQLHLKNVNLPSGVKLYISGDSAEPQEYSGHGIKGDGEIWGPLLDGGVVSIELQDTRTDAKNNTGPPTSFDLATLGHLFTNPISPNLTDFGDAGACNLDATCYPDWAAQSNSVARIEFSDQYYIYVCSAVLLNNLTNDGSPILLTANHCVNSPTLINSLSATWDYVTATCNGTPPYLQSLTTFQGMDLLSTDVVHDTTLLSVFNVGSNATFAAWTTADPLLGSYVTGIHHPSGSYRRISFGNTTSVPGFESYHSVHWQIGITEHGSSGSPLFDDAKRVVGTLTSGSSSCSNPFGVDNYHRFSLAYPFFVGSDGRKFLEQGLPDDHYAPNQTRQTAAVLQTGTEGNLVLKKSADDWFKISLRPIQTTIFGIGLYSGQTQAEIFVDDNLQPAATFSRGFDYRFYPDGIPHTVYLHLHLLSDAMIHYTTDVRGGDIDPPSVTVDLFNNPTWGSFTVFRYVGFTSAKASAWVEWGTDPNLSTFQQTQAQAYDPVLNINGSDYSVVAVVGLPSNTTIYYRGAASNVAGVNRTAIKTLRTAPLTPPNLTFPVNKADPVSTSTFLRWTGAAPEYDVYCGTDSNPAFLETIPNAADLYRTADNYRGLNNISPHTTYYWRVVAKYPSQDVSSDVYSFQTSDTLTPSQYSANFGNSLVGQLGTRQITLTNMTFQNLPISSITATGDFSQTNTCVLAQNFWNGQTCNITVSFRPTGLGTRTGSLTITANNDPGFPHVISLTGTGIEVIFAPKRPGRESRTAQTQSIIAGDSLQVPLSVSASAPLPPLNLSCTGLPVGANCAFATTAANPQYADVALTVSTTRRANAAVGRGKLNEDGDPPTGTPAGHYNVTVVLGMIGTPARTVVVPLDVR